MRQLVQTVLRESIDGPTLRTILDGSTQRKNDEAIILKGGDRIHVLSVMNPLYGLLADLYEALYHDPLFPRPDIVLKQGDNQDYSPVGTEPWGLK